jgi:hypothetical protein
MKPTPKNSHEDRAVFKIRSNYTHGYRTMLSRATKSYATFPSVDAFAIGQDIIILAIEPDSRNRAHGLPQKLKTGRSSPSLSPAYIYT